MRTRDIFVRLAVMLSVFHLSMSSAFAETEYGQNCWKEPISIPKGSEITLSAFDEKAPPRLSFNSAAPVKVTSDGGKYFLGANTGQVTLAPGGSGKLRAETPWKGVLVADQRSRLALTPDPGTEIKLPPGVALPSDGNLPAVADAEVVGSVHGRLADEALMVPYLAFDAEDKGQLPMFRGRVDAKDVPSIIPVNSLTVQVVDGSSDVYGNRGLLAACFKIAGEYYEAPILQVQELKTGVTELVLALPRGERSSLYDTGTVAVMLADGSFLDTDTFEFRGTWAGVAGGAAAVAVLLAVAWVFGKPAETVAAAGASGGRSSRLLAWWTGPGNKPSLSLFQILLWTLVVVFCLGYVWAITYELVAITPQVLGLLGIAGTGSVAAKIIGTMQGPPPETTAPRFGDMFRTDGVVDLYKLQMFIFTVGAAVYTVGRVVMDHAFPEIDSSLLLLLGISNGVYVASKLGETPLQTAARIETEKRLLEDQKKRIDDQIKALEKQRDDATSEKKAASDAVNAAPANDPGLQQLKDTLAEKEKALNDTEAALKLKNEELKDLAARIIKKSEELNAAVASIPK